MCRPHCCCCTRLCASLGGLLYWYARLAVCYVVIRHSCLWLWEIPPPDWVPMLSSLWMMNPRPWADGNELRSRRSLVLLLLLTMWVTMSASVGSDGPHIQSAIAVAGLVVARSIRILGLSVSRIWILWITAQCLYLKVAPS